MLFLFGDPIHAVVSTQVHRFERKHFLNCGYESPQLPDLFARDDLQYEQIFDSWMMPKAYPVLALRYECLQEHESTLSSFLGTRVRLLPKWERSTQVTPALRERLMPVYGRFVHKVDASPDASIRVVAERYQTPF